ncbi:type IX secretion system periplasmic lipoprotein PorW/SprE [Aurantibacillus circumpalustris]|uniref:type IX secretion system periplasmic lipoprotein PorW/SprE n=1 Tax=Aurantibacillus circumpalustris TaxID=3036359 RepID=UPI00295AE1E4|nr:tetratricopeptide repeat protein [Aurantibacillus circumpalustris]
MLVKRLLYFFCVSLLFVSCSTKKNALVNRAYHNLTARYNGYYYSGVAIDDGVYKIEKSNKENFDKILPIYIYPTPEQAKSTFPEFDKAIKKSSVCIQKHAIKDKKGGEIPSSGRWIDNNWINIGIAHFYKREFFSAIESFEYVVRTYTKSDDKYTAMLWLIKANNEIGAVSSSEPILGLLKNEKHLKKRIKNELPVVWADYYMRRGQNTEAIAKLLEATRNTSFINGIPKKKRARYSFIIAQLSEQSKDIKRATKYYKKTIALKPAYEMIFYSKIKLARLLDVKRNNSEKTKKDLLKMAREFKNSDYYDVIYYTLGEIEEKERNIKQAVYYYKKSVQKSVNNSNQKALSYLKLGEINFDLTNYTSAEAYYDSTIVTLPKDHPEYNSILARKKTLEALVGHIKTISREDSLQRISKMSPKEQEAFIDNLIAAYVKEQERKEKEAAAAALLAPTLPNNSNSNNALPGFAGNASSFYFYNQTTISFGLTDFQKKWGDRKLEDNWRRANKAMTIEDSKDEISDIGKTKLDSGIVPEKTREFYSKNLYTNDSLIRKSNNRIIKAYYMMGSIYKEDLNNNRKAIATFEELNTRFPQNHYLLRTYYVLYRTYLAEKNTAKADYYKDKILTEFPDSEFAALIKNPEIAAEINAKNSEVEAYYEGVYDAYKRNNFSESYSMAKEGISKYGKSQLLPKFEFVRSMSLGKLKGIDTLETNLKLLVAKYPKSDITPLSEDILLAIKKQKNPEAFKPKEEIVIPKDSFNLNFEGEHFIIAVTPDNPKIADEFKTRIGNFNGTYYSEKSFNVSSSLFGSKKQLIVIKSFGDAKIATEYYENFNADPDIFKGDVKRELFSVFPILSDNLPILYKSKNIDGYEAFYMESYKKLNSKN